MFYANSQGNHIDTQEFPLCRHRNLSTPSVGEKVLQTIDTKQTLRNQIPSPNMTMKLHLKL